MTSIPVTTGRAEVVAEDPRGAVTAPSGLRRLQREMTRERLVQAAAESFSTRGYVATTIDDITGGAGATRATFYLHFKSKADVVLEVVDKLGGEYRSAYRLLVAAVEQPDAEAIQRWLARTVLIWDRTARLSAVASEAATMEPAVQRFRAAAYERDIALLESALQRRGRWDAQGCRVRAVLLFSQLEQVFERWSVLGWDIDRGEMVKVLSAMWCAALDLGEPTG